MDKRKLQWHPAFFAVLQIELGKDRKYLRFYAEYNLTRKPLQIDVLVVKAEPGREIQKTSAVCSAGIMWLNIKP